MGIQNDQFEQI